jgi:hypothetical protein
MMEQFKNWYVRNQDAITWFLIGFFTAQGIYEFATGDYVWAIVSFVLAYVNYKLSHVRLQ